MRKSLDISVVIPTCNRKESLLRLLGALAALEYPLNEIIVVDSSDRPLKLKDVSLNNTGTVKLLHSRKSVCAQRNAGIAVAQSPWIFLCDDDIEMPPDYLTKLTAGVALDSGIGAVSGLILQKEAGEWVKDYPVKKGAEVLWRHFFQLGFWGKITYEGKNSMISSVARNYSGKNILSKAGWPIVTNLESEICVTPVYGLGASLVRRDWLLLSPYEEKLDAHGIGDNYGVAMGFPGLIHVLTSTFVYHHREQGNRVTAHEVQARRALAMDMFLKTKPRLSGINRVWFVWSLLGKVVSAVLTLDLALAFKMSKVILLIVFNLNPYLREIPDRKKRSD